MDVVGGGVLVAVAAALWLAYLMPNWLRRRQYNATERNAVRLQQTLRILAETAETPEPVRLEATAREVAAQQRILAAQEQTAKLEAETARLAAEAAEQLALADRRAAAEAVAAARSRATQLTVTEPIAIVPTRPSTPPASAESAAARGALDDSAARLARRRLRRARALSSLVLLLSIVTVLVGLAGIAFGWSALVAVVGALGAVVAFGSVAVLARRRPAPTRSTASAPAAARPASPAFEPIEVADDAEAPAGWTPQPLPRPLHLSRGTIAATAMASIEAAAELQRVAAGEAIAARAERLAPEVPVLRRQVSERAPEVAPSAAPAAAAPANPYAAMGRVEASDPALDDLDAVLRRRRAV